MEDQGLPVGEDPLGITITYSAQDTILGTAGGAKQIASLFDNSFVFIHGDVLANLVLKALVASHFSWPKETT